MSIKNILCFLIHKSYVRSIKRYCFVRKYAAIPLLLLLLFESFLSHPNYLQPIDNSTAQFSVLLS